MKAVMIASRRKFPRGNSTVCDLLSRLAILPIKTTRRICPTMEPCDDGRFSPLLPSETEPLGW